MNETYGLKITNERHSNQAVELAESLKANSGYTHVISIHIFMNLSKNVENIPKKLFKSLFCIALTKIVFKS